jgi:two-component system LytT family response regulator
MGIFRNHIYKTKQNAMTLQSTITLATAEGRYFFNPEEIIRLEASSNYTRIYFINNKKMVSAKVLKEFVPMLEPFGFVRTHRTHLVNRKHILCVTAEGNIIMKDASVAEISRRMKSGVMKVLKNAA